MPKVTDKALFAHDAKRDIGAELLEAVRDLRAGHRGRKTTIETLADRFRAASNRIAEWQGSEG